MPLITSARTHPVVRGIKIGSNQPPQWQSVPTPSFVLGVASNFPPSGTYQSNGYVTDANGDSITITWLTGSVSGVTWDGGKFVYSGAGSVGTTGSLVLRATDGTDHADSSAFSIEIASGLAWSTTPSISFVEASVTPTNLGVYVTNYNASTDEFRVTPGYSLPSWLALTPGPGTGSGNLTPSGAQVDGDDVDVLLNPIKIDVRRSGGAWVSSNAFGVTVYVAGSGVATWVDLADTAINAHAEFLATDLWPNTEFNMPNPCLRFGFSSPAPSAPNQAAWDAWALLYTDQSQVEWVNAGTPHFGAFVMYAVDHDQNMFWVLPG